MHQTIHLPMYHSYGTTYTPIFPLMPWPVCTVGKLFNKILFKPSHCLFVLASTKIVLIHHKAYNGYSYLLQTQSPWNLVSLSSAISIIAEAYPVHFLVTMAILLPPSTNTFECIEISFSLFKWMSWLTHTLISTSSTDKKTKYHFFLKQIHEGYKWSPTVVVYSFTGIHSKSWCVQTLWRHLLAFSTYSCMYIYILECKQFLISCEDWYEKTLGLWFNVSSYWKWSRKVCSWISIVQGNMSIFKLCYDRN